VVAVILLYNDAERALAEDCVHRMVKRAVEMEGTVTVCLVGGSILEVHVADER
jgi:hypothetical protein